MFFLLLNPRWSNWLGFEGPGCVGEKKDINIWAVREMQWAESCDVLWVKKVALTVSLLFLNLFPIPCFLLNLLSWRLRSSNVFFLKWNITEYNGLGRFQCSGPGGCDFHCTVVLPQTGAMALVELDVFFLSGLRLLLPIMLSLGLKP